MSRSLVAAASVLALGTTVLAGQVAASAPAPQVAAIRQASDIATHLRGRAVFIAAVFIGRPPFTAEVDHIRKGCTRLWRPPE